MVPMLIKLEEFAVFVLFHAVLASIIHTVILVFLLIFFLAVDAFLNVQLLIMLIIHQFASPVLPFVRSAHHFHYVLNANLAITS